jgi:hypothetical protein
VGVAIASLLCCLWCWVISMDNTAALQNSRAERLLRCLVTSALVSCHCQPVINKACWQWFLYNVVFFHYSLL